MTTSIAVEAFDAQPPARGRSLVHVLTLGLVWLAFATSGIVFSEPAPCDVLMAGLIVLLPLVRLARLTPVVSLQLMAWLAIVAGAYLGVTQSGRLDIGIKHTTVTLFLALSSVVVAAFLAANPERHARIVMAGYTTAALLATLAAIAGYFSLLPGAFELFTLHSRARGTFQDPNVYGPFIVPILLYAGHNMLVGGVRQTLTSGALFVILLFGLLLTFSRGAWFNAAIAFLLYGVLAFVTSPTNRRRLKLIVIAALGATVGLAVLAAAMQIEAVASLLGHRASLSMAYDAGPEGRFGGQLKAMGLILVNPLGLGALEFSRVHHVEDVHNVYLNMFLNAGWLGGLLYLMLVGATLLAGARHALRATPSRGLAIVSFASFAGLAAEGLVIDTDHWRHFFVLLGLIWGPIAAHAAADARARRRASPASE